MTTPNVNVDIQDGALGILPTDIDSLHVKIGVAAAGTKNQLVSLSSIKQVKETFESGQLADAAAFALKVGGGPIYAMRAEASTAATTSSVTATRAGSSDGTLAISGSALDDYDATVEITQSGSVANGAGAFRYTLDGGDTYSNEIALTASYAIPNTGLTLNFTDGIATPTFEEGDTFAFTTVGPKMTTADLDAAFTALLADSRAWSFAHVVGSVTPSIAAAVDTHMASAESNKRFVFAVLEARDFQSSDVDMDGWRTNLLSEWATHAANRSLVVAGHTETLSPLTSRIHRRSGAWHETARLASTPVHEHPGRVLTGPLVGLTKIYHDEAATPGLRDGRFATLRTIVGRQGFYLTDGVTRAASGSDYQSVQNRRVMDKACRIATDAALTFLNESVRVNDTGNIFEPDAAAIEAFVEGALQASLLSTGNASDVEVVVDRASDILASSALTISVRVRPVGYMSFITVDIGFINPSREPTAAQIR